MTEFKTEAGRPIYISDEGEIVSEKSVTIKMGNKFVNVPSIHDGIQYSEDELAELIKNKEIKPTSTHKTKDLAIKAAEKRSPSLMSEDTARAIEDKYKEEIIKKRAAFEAEENAAELITPEGKARRQMDILLEIEEDPFNDMVPGDKDKKIQSRLDSLSDQEKELMKKVLKMPKTKIKSVDADDYAANVQKKRVGDMDEKMLSFAEGGLLDEGGTVDPVSGNEVPAGSTQEEVRDDIPAQLSEGEFVFPADVVRYIGLENLMKLRQKAKAGLKLMEDMGQMGNSEEAVAEDDLEYIAEIDMLIDDFDPEEDEEERNFAVGGFNPPQIPNFSLPSYNAPTTEQMIFGGGTGQTPFSGVQSPVKYTSEEYIGPSGERVTITFINGQPVYPIPEGYKKYDPTKAVKQAPVVAQPKVQQPRDDGGREPEAPTTDMGTLGNRTLADAVGVLSEVNPKLDKAFANRPKGLKDLVVKGLIPSLISSINYGIEETKAIKELEQGYGLTNFDPDSNYGKWRSGLDNAYMASAVLETEKEAREVVSGDKDWRESNFGSEGEANAVAKSGWGSDEHFDEIDKQFEDLPETTGGTQPQQEDNERDDDKETAGGSLGYDPDTGLT